MINFLLAALLFIFCGAAGCTTTRDIFVDTQRSHTAQRLTDVEAAIIPLEAAGGNEARRRTGEITAARQLIASAEREAHADADFSAQLTAWSGRLAILEGRYSEAVRLHRHSIAASPGNLPAVILSVRLEGDPARRLELIDRELAIIGQRGAGIGELNIERGNALLELNRFSESAGAFDAAFALGINNVYRESYENNRHRAWELRNTSGVSTGTLNLLVRDSISWSDCLALANNETRLFRFITGGRNISVTELFNRLVDRAFIPFTQNIALNEWPSARPRADEAVTRAGAAWLVWHLYAESRADRGMLSRYSARFATGANPRSPIADVPPLSPFLDSIIGCVETEFMSLPDGRNFRPEQFMRGAELLAILRRIDD